MSETDYTETGILLTPARNKHAECENGGQVWELTRYVAGIPSRIATAIASALLENADTDYELYTELVNMNEI